MQHVVGLNTASGDDRTMQTRSRLRRKLGQRKATDTNNSNSNNSQQNQKISPPQKSTVNGTLSDILKSVHSYYNTLFHQKMVDKLIYIQ